MKYFDGSTTHTTSYTYNNGNQLTERHIFGLCFSYQYDANGNMTREEEDKEDLLRTFQWNEDNRLIEAVNYGTGHVYYTYDALGRRIQRFDPASGIRTLYYYDGLTVIAEKQQEENDPWYWNRNIHSSAGRDCVARILLVLLCMKIKSGLMDPWRRTTQPPYITVGQQRLAMTMNFNQLASMRQNDNNSGDSEISKCQRTKIRQSLDKAKTLKILANKAAVKDTRNA
ncbi:MAG: hypothetical protein NT106_01075 [Candidatus Sumerlaeota bacterium]|nr:hypothetical protein [Candidatus Sumerlaeota bacterium]